MDHLYSDSPNLDPQTHEEVYSLRGQLRDMILAITRAPYPTEKERRESRGSSDSYDVVSKSRLDNEGHVKDPALTRELAIRAIDELKVDLGGSTKMQLDFDEEGKRKFFWDFVHEDRDHKDRTFYITEEHNLKPEPGEVPITLEISNISPDERDLMLELNDRSKVIRMVAKNEELHAKRGHKIIKTLGRVMQRGIVEPLRAVTPHPKRRTSFSDKPHN